MFFTGSSFSSMSKLLRWRSAQPRRYKVWSALVGRASRLTRIPGRRPGSHARAVGATPSGRAAGDRRSRTAGALRGTAQTAARRDDELAAHRPGPGWTAHVAPAERHDAVLRTADARRVRGDSGGTGLDHQRARRRLAAARERRTCGRTRRTARGTLGVTARTPRRVAAERSLRATRLTAGMLTAATREADAAGVGTPIVLRAADTTTAAARVPRGTSRETPSGCALLALPAAGAPADRLTGGTRGLAPSVDALRSFEQQSFPQCDRPSSHNPDDTQKPLESQRNDGRLGQHEPPPKGPGQQMAVLTHCVCPHTGPDCATASRTRSGETAAPSTAAPNSRRARRRGIGSANDRASRSSLSSANRLPARTAPRRWHAGDPIRSARVPRKLPGSGALRVLQPVQLSNQPSPVQREAGRRRRRPAQIAVPKHK